jgi:glutamine synthetase
MDSSVGSLPAKEAYAKAAVTPEGISCLERIEHLIAEHEIKYVRFEQYDLYGIPRSKTVPVAYFRYYLENGLNFYGGILTCDVQTRCAPNTGYGEEVTYGDALTIPDLNSFMVLPWVPHTARVIIDPHWYDGTPLMGTPRLMLKKLLADFERRGYAVRLGYEFELYLFDAQTKEPVYGSQPIFNTLYNNFDVDYLYGMMDMLQSSGFRIITQNSEQGPGQQEINLDCRDGLDAIDEAQTFKYAIKEISRQYGYIASFMTKPYIDRCASGAHIHFSLIDKATGANAFVDEASQDGLSELCHRSIAGMVRHAAANTVFSAPTVNCYKRYRPGVCAPTTATWGYENRSVGIRVKGRRGQSSTHVENRLYCSASNPYVATLSLLTASLLGIENGYEGTAPCAHDVWADESIPKLPASAADALQAFVEDTVLQEAYGPEFTKVVLAMKEWDLKVARENCEDFDTPAFNDYVSDWELAEFRDDL